MSVAKERCPAFVCLCGGSPGRGTLASVECFSLRTGTWEALSLGGCMSAAVVINRGSFAQWSVLTPHA